MEVNGSGQLPVQEGSQIGESRRRALHLARTLGFDETDAGRVAVVASELATNLVKHARGGEMSVRPVEEGGRLGVELVAVDRGPGIQDLGGALRDGFSSAGTAGTGLGAIRRMASTFDVFTLSGSGTAMVARVFEQPPGREPFEVGVTRVPYPGEAVCGDDWATRMEANRTLFLVVDGLGHGTGAAEASAAARTAFLAGGSRSPGELMDSMHRALRPTRGAAAAVAEVDAGSGSVRYSGIGNISGTVVSPGRSQAMVSLSGTLGHQVRGVQEFSYGWPAGALLIMHSDGISARWSLELYPGLLTRHASLVAAVLVRDFARGRDDATVLAARSASDVAP